MNNLIFDADGVLIEPWGFATLLERDHGIAAESTRRFFYGPFQECLLGQSELVEILPPYLKDWRWSGTMSEFIDLWMSADDRPDLQMLALVERLRAAGAVCCLASNQERTRARYMASRMGFAERFDRLYFSHALGFVKPHEDFYRAIERDLRVAAGEIFFWDDSPGHVEAAARRGWNAFLYEGPQSVTSVLGRPA
jgi:putative hydrolase of the HAD superfamily